MGIEKPYEVETHRLGWAPGPPAPLDVEGRMAALIVPLPSGIRLAGRVLELPADEHPERRALELRARLAERLRERRPHANERTWDQLVNVLRGMLRDGQLLDAQTEEELIEAIDGL